jgi:nucleotide-binding universal stress UspA family protein
MGSRPDGWSAIRATCWAKTKEDPMNSSAIHRPRTAENDYRRPAEHHARPIVAAVDGLAASRAAIGEAVRLAGELEAPIVFVYVRRGPAGFLGAPVYQQRLNAEMARAERVLDRAVAVASDAGIAADGEVLEGSPARRISEFARDRGARLIVVGSRKHKLGRGVSGATRRAAGRPVVVARAVAHPAAA